MTWVLLITAIFANGTTYTAEFPMANEEECRSEIEWPGNAPHAVMTMGVDFITECKPVLQKGEYVL